LELLPGTLAVPNIKIFDRAHELRIQIVGRFQGQSVTDVSHLWRDAMRAPTARKCTVDISRLSGYDAAGFNLLREMHHHGTQIAAGTPLSLVFLNEISMPRRRGPAIVRERPKTAETAAAPLRMRAAGE
jgi:ABC-type transporter Mla MlaB component